MPFSGLPLNSQTLPIHLRTYTTSTADITAIHSILANPLNNELDRSPNKDPSPNGPSYDSIAKFVALSVASNSDAYPTRCNLVVVETSDSGAEEIVGLAGYGAIKYVDDAAGGTVSIDGVKKRFVANAGVMLNPSARGKGYGLEAMKLGMQWVFEQARADEVTVTMLERNVRMKAIMTKLQSIGFVGECETEVSSDGETELNYCMKRGQWAGWKA